MGAAVVLTGLTLIINFSDVCQLEAVTLNGLPLEGWEDELGLRREVISRQPVDHVAAKLLAEDGVLKVDVDYRLPGRIDIRTNQFTPVCLVLDSRTGVLRGLNEQARTVPLQPGMAQWEHPVLVNVKASRLFDYCGDHRVRRVIPQLAGLREDFVDLYRLIEEIDFASPDYLTLSISGLTYRLRVDADQLTDQLSAFVSFLEQFQPDLETTRMLDLRYDDIIVQGKKAETRG